MNITCPESAHLETVDMVRDARGLRVIRCTVYCNGPVECPRTCAMRLEAKLATRKVHGPGTVLVARSCLGR